NWIRSRGKSTSDFGAQREFLNYEMDGGGAWTPSTNFGTYTFNDLKKASDPSWTAEGFCRAYERPAVSTAKIGGRRSYAEQFYSKYAGKSSAKKSTNSGSSSTATTASAITVSGNPSLALRSAGSRAGSDKGLSKSTDSGINDAKVAKQLEYL